MCGLIVILHPIFILLALTFRHFERHRPITVMLPRDGKDEKDEGARHT